MLRLLPLLLLVTACSEERRDEAAPAPPMPPEAPIPQPAAAAMKSEPLMPVPGDKAQLDRLLTLGYTVHDDHMHKPGVAACPKMSNDMVR